MGEKEFHSKLESVPSLRYRSLQQGHWSRHYWAVVTSTFQLMGTIFYFGCEWSDGFVHLPETVRVWVWQRGVGGVEGVWVWQRDVGVAEGVCWCESTGRYL